MPTLIFTYSPKPDVEPAEFERFLEEVDQPVTLSLPSAISSRIFRVLDPGAGFAYLEVLDITSFDEWQRDSQTDEVAAVAAQWPQFGNMAELKSYNCEEFYAGSNPNKA